MLTRSEYPTTRAPPRVLAAFHDSADLLPLDEADSWLRLALGAGMVALGGAAAAQGRRPPRAILPAEAGMAFSPCRSP